MHKHERAALPYLTADDAPQLIAPLSVSDPSPFIERAYRQTKNLQWVREALLNSIEAGATRIELAMEPESMNLPTPVYRYAIYDNGCGIAEDEFERFLMTYGGGGKPIGDAWENFGIGVKSCLLPWNKYGLVVVSIKGGSASMIWLEGKEVVDNGRKRTKYGARIWKVPADEGLGTEDRIVIAPWKTAGIDFERVIPAWIGIKDEKTGLWVAQDGEPAHGTILILMGNEKDEDSVFGDRARGEAMNHTTGNRLGWPEHMYIENRFWTIANGIEIGVKMPTNVSRDKWPKSREEWEKSVLLVEEEGNEELVKKKRAQRRTCNGALHWITHPYGLDKSRIPPTMSGIIEVGGSIPAKIHWFLRHKDFPMSHWHHGKSRGYVAVLYNNEIYDRTESKDKGTTAALGRFGVLHNKVQQRVFVVVEPQALDEKNTIGVYPAESRSRLCCTTATAAAQDLPWEEWAEQFREKMPQAIRDAEDELDNMITVDDAALDEECMKRVAEMGDHFYYKRPVETTGGVAAILVEGQEPTKGRHLPTDPPGGGIAPSRPVRPRPPVDPGYGDGKDGPDTTEGTRLVTKEGGDKTAKERRVRTKVPRPRWQPANEMTDGWVMAQFVPTKYEVYLNEEHPVYREMLDYVKKHWLVTAEQSVRAVRQAFASSAISKVAHVLHSRAIFSSTSEGVKKTTKDIVDAALSEEALSMALMGWHDIYNGVEKQLRHKGSK